MDGWVFRRACMRWEILTKLWSKVLKIKDLLEDPDVDDRLMLRYIYIYVCVCVYA